MKEQVLNVLFGQDRQISVRLLLLGALLGCLPAASYLTGIYHPAAYFTGLISPDVLFAPLLLVPVTISIWVADGLVEAWWLLVPLHASALQVTILTDYGFVATSLLELFAWSIGVAVLLSLVYVLLGRLLLEILQTVHDRSRTLSYFR